MNVDLATIHLNNNDFSGTLPTDIFLLNNIISLDLSHNSMNNTYFGASMPLDDVLSSYGNYSSIITLRLNDNNFHGHVPERISIMGQLKELDLSNNDIHDAASNSIVKLLQNNMKIETLDLGFNQLTDAISDKLKKAYGVESTSSIEKKVCSLHVNVVGNNCDTYMLGEPGMGRSKMNYRFGINPSAADDLNDGYSHVNQTSRNHNFLRKNAFDDKIYRNHNLLKPIKHMN